MGVQLPFEPGWCRTRSLVSVGFGEFLGTALLGYVVSTALTLAPTPASVPVCIAGAVLALCNIFGDLSGAHFNPSITVAYLLTEARFSLTRATIYLITQVVGAILGTELGAYNAVSPLPDPYSVDLHIVKYSIIQIGLAEFVWTAMLCLTALRAGFLLVEPSPYTPIWIAGVIIAGSYSGGAVSGNCMNPALAIAYSVRTGSWLDLVMYTLAPTIGAVFAAMMAMLMDPQIWARRVGLSASAANLRISSSGVSTAGLEMSPSEEYLRGGGAPCTGLPVREHTHLHQRSISRPTV